MRNIYEVLREKEEAVAQVRREIETLRSVTPFPWRASEENTRLDRSERPAECLEVMRGAGGQTKEVAVAQVPREIETLRSVTPFPWRASEENTRLDRSERPAECLEVMRGAVGQTEDELDPPVTPAVDEMEEALDKIRTRLVEAADSESKLRGPKKISRHLRHMAASLLGTTLH